MVLKARGVSVDNVSCESQASRIYFATKRSSTSVCGTTAAMQLTQTEVDERVCAADPRRCQAVEFHLPLPVLESWPRDNLTSNRNPHQTKANEAKGEYKLNA